jgi:hypothetical protein
LVLAGNKGSDQMVRQLHAALLLSVLTLLIDIQVDSYFAASTSAFMIKVRDCLYYLPMILAGVSEIAFAAAYAPRMFEVHPGARSGHLSIHRAPY